MKNAVNDVMDQLRDPSFIHVTKKDLIMSKFTLTHGQGKRKRKKKGKKK